jgi:hypothetical protein
MHSRSSRVCAGMRIASLNRPLDILKLENGGCQKQKTKMNANTRYTRRELIGQGKYRVKFIHNNVTIIEAEVNEKQLQCLKSLEMQWIHEGLSITDIEAVLKHVLTTQK